MCDAVQEQNIILDYIIYFYMHNYMEVHELDLHIVQDVRVSIKAAGSNLRMVRPSGGEAANISRAKRAAKFWT